MGKFLAISEKELQVLEAWSKHGSIKAAAEVLGIPPTTAYTRITRLKWRYRTAKEFIREFDRWASKLPSPLEVLR